MYQITLKLRADLEDYSLHKSTMLCQSSDGENGAREIRKEEIKRLLPDG